MIRLTKDKVLELHAIMARVSGGSAGLRDEALLESALESAFAGFGGEDFYPTLLEKAARLGYALVANHAFVDGNKRIGLFVMLVFLSANGLRPTFTNAELVTLGLALADGSIGYSELLAELVRHTTV